MKVRCCVNYCGKNNLSNTQRSTGKSCLATCMDKGRPLDIDRSRSVGFRSGNYADDIAHLMRR